MLPGFMYVCVVREYALAHMQGAKEVGGESGVCQAGRERGEGSALHGLVRRGPRTACGGEPRQV